MIMTTTTVAVLPPLISINNAIGAKNRLKLLHREMAQQKKANRRRLVTTWSSCPVPYYKRNVGRRRNNISCNSFKSTRFRNVIVCSKVPLLSNFALEDHDKDEDAVVYTETYPLRGTKKVKGKIYTRIDQGKKDDQWQLTVGCTVPGKWIMHWGVHYIGDSGREWDQPPSWMRPLGSVAVKDYAVETPLKEVVEPGENCVHEVKIDFYSNCAIADIKFLLKDVETGSWYRCNEKDFCVPLTDYLCEGGNIDISAWNNFTLWLGVLSKLPYMMPRGEDPKSLIDHQESTEELQPNKQIVGFYDEQDVVKNISLDFSLKIVVRKCPVDAKNIVYLETNLSEEATIHWGVCKDDRRLWEIPPAPYPLDAEVFKDRALRTKLKPKEDGSGRVGTFALDNHIAGLLFVIKLDGDTWLKCNGQDFFVPLPPPTRLSVQSEPDLLEGKKEHQFPMGSKSGEIPDETQVQKQEASQPAHSDGIINNIRNVVADLSSENWKILTKEAQEAVLHEIERLGAAAYSMFRSSIPTFSGEADPEPAEMKPLLKLTSGTGSGYEILCQGFNWESHRSGRWYMELEQKAAELSSLGFTIIWLPPPTESVSPEGYMPKDLYNLNSRYGTMDELRAVVNKFHQVGMKVLGDAVLNHRCAHFQNAKGVWNIFGGRLNWDDTAVVSDDPHFQGRGNKSSGDNFHAAPNIDHSQEFVRKDLEEWLCWLRKDVGYDGWRLDFVRGFSGGYVKDYIKASKPYFAVGEFWDSLSYTYHVMDYNQDAHRQRIIDWIQATEGTAGAFDVTTKGVLHTVLERCEYWRLSDAYGKPPGVLGWWPSRAVTFIENHDTGSTQGHWRFPEGKEMQGYAYILTHAGTPTVFYDHIFSHYRSEIAALIALRNRNKIQCRSIVSIMKAEKDVYAATIDDMVAMKIGPGYYEPPSEKTWSLALEGNCYKVWEAS